MTQTDTRYNLPSDEPVDPEMLAQRAPSVPHLLRDRIASTPQALAFTHPTDDGWGELTWDQVGQRSWALAAGLIDLGVEPQDRVSIAASTRLEWALSDYAVMVAGAATTTIYPSTVADDVAFILDDSGSVVVIAEDAAQLAKITAVREQIPQVRTVVVMDPAGVEVGATDGWVTTLAELERRGEARLATEPGLVDERIEAISPSDLATIIYTSGTTGRPKGVRLLHSAWTYQAAASMATGLLDADDVQYLWLPLAHVFGKLLLVLPVAAGCSTAIDGRIDKIVDNLAVVRPTFMAAAPRIFEKVHAKVTLGMAAEGGAKERLFTWAVGVGSRVAEARREGRPVTRADRMAHPVADRLVLSKVRARFGGRVRYFVSGSASLNDDVARWFDAVGLTILEGYGLTESSAATTINRPAARRLGSVGWANPGTELRIAEDGEVLIRGDGVMEGYHRNEAATREVLTPDGWFATGDIGHIDERGFLTITDRKKDLFKTSNGKYVAPSQIESTFKGLCPYVSQFLVIGADRHFVTALVTLDPEAIQPWAAANGLEGADYTTIVSSPQARDMVQTYVDQLNEGRNRWEHVGRFTILGRDLSIEEGELTPSLKLRRTVVTDKFRGDIDAMYSAS